MSASQHIVKQIILESANVLVENIPKAFVKAQGDDRIEKERSDSISSEPEPPHTVSSFHSTCSQSLTELQDFDQKLKDDDRLGQIYKLQYNFSERFDNRAFIHPHGTTSFDYKGIPERRKENFESFKNRVRRDNYKYLCAHPEIRALVSLFTKKLLAVRPANPTYYLAEYFTTRIDGSDFKETLKNEMNKLSRYHVSKLKAERKITNRPIHYAEDDVNNETGKETEGATVSSEEVNFLKRLNIGPLAQDFYFYGSAKPKPKQSMAPPAKPKKKKKCKICPHYCVCIKGKGVRRKDLESKTVEKSSEQKSTTMAILSGGEEDTGEEKDEFEDDHHDRKRIINEIIGGLHQTREE